tara:strand:+ start:151 stop:453 length:303 start_codon:yes stop_codon:yes gene_type:complete
MSHSDFNQSGDPQNQSPFDLLPDEDLVPLPIEDLDAFRREMLEFDTNPDYDPEVPLVAGGYIDDQSKWYDGTGEWLLYLLGFVSGGVMAWLIIYAVGRFL